MAVHLTHKQVDESYLKRGYKWNIIAGQTTFFDVQVASAMIYLSGGDFAVCGVIAEGDYAEMSIVDKDDVLGLFALYGLTVGVDVIELKKYVKTYYFLPGDDGNRINIEPGTVAEVYYGLYMRASYTSVGVDDLKMFTWYDWFES